MLVAAALLVIIASMPLLLSAQLPLVDMPSHLARLGIVDQLLKGGQLADFWELEPGFVPNLVFDGLGLALHQIFSIDLAGSVYLALTLAAQLFGTVLLHRVLHGRYSYWPLTAAPLLYNLNFFYGFLSYLTGVGLVLLSLALWIVIRARHAWLRVAAGSAAAMLLFLAHMVPLVVYAAAVAGYELEAAVLMRHRPRAALGRLSVGATQFVLPVVLFLCKTSTAGLAQEAVAFDLEGKLASLPATLTSGLARLDAYTVIAAAVCLLLAPFALQVRVARGFRTAFVFVLAAFVIMPWGVGTLVNLDIRMPLAIFLIAIALVDLSLKRRRLGCILAGAMVVIFVVRVAGVSLQTASFADRLNAYRAAFALLPAGSVLFTGVNDRCALPPVPGNACQERDDPPPGSLLEAPRRLLYPGIYLRRLYIPPNIAALASSDRDVLVPQIFATRGLQPIGIRPAFAHLKALQENNPITIRTHERMQAVTAELLAATEAVLPGRPVFLLQQQIEGAARFAPDGAVRLATGPQFALYQLSGGPSSSASAIRCSTALAETNTQCQWVAPSIRLVVSSEAITRAASSVSLIAAQAAVNAAPALNWPLFRPDTSA